MTIPAEIWKAIDEVFVAAGLKPIPQGTKWEEALPKINGLKNDIKQLMKFAQALAARDICYCEDDTLTNGTGICLTCEAISFLIGKNI